ncbi:hypothetical protein EJB05_24366, partial [Eragrostis curvula]
MTLPGRVWSLHVLFLAPGLICSLLVISDGVEFRVLKCYPQIELDVPWISLGFVAGLYYGLHGHGLAATFTPIKQVKANSMLSRKSDTTWEISVRETSRDGTTRSPVKLGIAASHRVSGVSGFPRVASRHGLLLSTLQLLF